MCQSEFTKIFGEDLNYRNSAVFMQAVIDAQAQVIPPAIANSETIREYKQELLNQRDINIKLSNRGGQSDARALRNYEANKPAQSQRRFHRKRPILPRDGLH